MKISRIPAAIVIILMFAACDGAGFLVMEEEPVAPVTVDTIRAGKLVRPEETLPIDIVYNSDTAVPDTMLVELVDGDGETVSETVMDHFQTGLPFPDIALPENLAFGTYTLRFTIYESETLLAVTETPFFYTADEYSIRSIEAYPLVFFPGGDGLLFASFEYPVDDEAVYVRWSRDDSVLAEGMLADGLDMIQINAPDREGIHSIALELFPEPPPEGQAYLFRSPIEAEINIFVSRDQKPIEKDLLPDGNYYSVLHMRGEMTDTGFIGSGADPADVEGVSVLDIRDDLFGYTLDVPSSIIMPYAALPVANGTFAPFTLTLRLQLDDAPDGGELFVCATDDGSFSFTLAVNRTFGFRTSINTGGKLIESEPLQPIDPYAVELLSLSVIPDQSSVEVRWYADGALMGMDSFAVPESYLDLSEGYTEIGGGIGGLVDEVGVYYRNDRGKPSPDPTVFLRSMFEAYGEELLLAEGFDGLAVPADLLISGPTGKVFELASSSLRLQPAMSLTLPPFSVDGGNVGFVFGIVDGERATRITIRDADSETVLCSFSPSGTLATADGTYPLPEDASASTFYLFSSDDGYGIGIGKSRYFFSEVPETLTDFTVTLENAGTGIVAVGDLLVRDISEREELESRAGLSISNPSRRSSSVSATNSGEPVDATEGGGDTGAAESDESAPDGARVDAGADPDDGNAADEAVEAPQDVQDGSDESADNGEEDADVPTESDDLIADDADGSDVDGEIASTAETPSDASPTQAGEAEPGAAPGSDGDGPEPDLGSERETGTILPADGAVEAE
jgi:hypothetical protein